MSSTIEVDEMTQEYARRIRPLLPLAKRAYGSRTQSTPAHDASREYTRLLVEFHERGGSLTALAKELDVAYAGMRRRVVMRNVDVSSVRPAARGSMDGVSDAVTRILAAKSISVDAYHDQLAEEYRSGISLAGIARELKLSSSAPLYYGVQRSLQRHGVLSDTALDPMPSKTTAASEPEAVTEETDGIDVSQELLP